jgi:hypothetical protein
MQTVKKWNAISSELKATIPEFGRGEIKNFQMLNGRKNDQDDPKEREKFPILYPRTQIPTKDRIFDPYLNNGKGGYVDIIVADSWADDEPTRSRFFLPGESDFRFGGKWALSGGSVGDQEMFEYCWLTNYRRDNPNRDLTVQPLFEYIDVLKISKKEEATEDEIFEALSKVRSLSKEEESIRKIAASLNWASNQEFSILLSSMKVYARQNPSHFLELASTSDKILSSKADIKGALDSGILFFDPTNGRLTNKNNLLTTFDIYENFSIIDEAAAWIASSANGEDILKSIRKQSKK